MSDPIDNGDRSTAANRDMNARLRDRDKPTATAWFHRLFGTPASDDDQPATDTDDDGPETAVGDVEAAAREEICAFGGGCPRRPGSPQR